jgi:hypothetical protein
MYHFISLFACSLCLTEECEINVMQPELDGENQAQPVKKICVAHSDIQMKITVFWDMTLCSLVDRSQCSIFRAEELLFRRTAFYALKMEAAGSSKTLVQKLKAIVSSEALVMICQTIQWHIAGDSNLHCHYCENLSQIVSQLLKT